VLARLEVESASVQHDLMVAGSFHCQKVVGKRDGNLLGEDTASLKRNSESMERAVAQTTNQKVRKTEGRRLADMFEALADYR